MPHASAWQALVPLSNANKAKAVLAITILAVLGGSLIWGRDLTRTTYDAVEAFANVYAPMIALIGRPLDQESQRALLYGFGVFIDLLHEIGTGVGVLGFAFLFWGYVFHLLFVMLPGIVYGGILGNRVVPDSESPQGMAAMVVGSAIGGMLTVVLYAVGVLILGFAAGYLVVVEVVELNDPTAVHIIAGIVGAVLMLVLEKYLAMLYTSVTGAVLVAGAFGLRHTAVMVALTLSGMFVQYHLRKGFWRRRSRDKDKKKRAAVESAPPTAPPPVVITVRRDERATLHPAEVITAPTDAGSEPPSSEPLIAPDRGNWKFLDDLIRTPDDKPPR